MLVKGVLEQVFEGQAAGVSRAGLLGPRRQGSAVERSWLVARSLGMQDLVNQIRAGLRGCAAAQ